MVAAAQLENITGAAVEAELLQPLEITISAAIITQLTNDAATNLTDVSVNIVLQMSFLYVELVPCVMHIATLPQND